MTSALVDLQDPPAAPPGVPARIGRFVIREEIGRGSNGVVYSATDPVLGRDVAIKAIPLDARHPAQRDVEANFLQEAKMAAGLNHPSIVTVFDAGKSDSVAYIAMERLNGLDLHHWMSANRPMSAESAAALIARVCDAVHFAHRRGLIHRDIKPSNIFLSRDMKPKVLDFGIALAQGKQSSPDEPAKLIGTPNYMSPEQAMGRPLDARSDVFSIGAILYELITGQRAFDGTDVDDILNKVVKVDPPPLSSARPDVALLMEEIVARALAKNPLHRYQTAAQLRNDLASFAGRPVTPATAAPGELPPLPPPDRRHLPGRGAVAATVAAVVGLSLTFAFWNWGQHGDAAAPDREAASNAQAVPTGAAPVAARAGPASAGPGAAAPIAHPAASSSAPGAMASAHAAGAAPEDRAAKAAHHTADASRAVRKRPASPPPPPPPPAPVEPGTLTLAVVPWGQVYVDGNDVGVSPPLNKLNLAPGPHMIEVRNGSAPAYQIQVDVTSGQTRLLQHHF